MNTHKGQIFTDLTVHMLMVCLLIFDSQDDDSSIRWASLFLYDQLEDLIGDFVLKLCLPHVCTQMYTGCVHDAFLHDAYIHNAFEPWPWYMCVWCKYHWTFILTLMHVCTMPYIEDFAWWSKVWSWSLMHKCMMYLLFLSLILVHAWMYDTCMDVWCMLNMHLIYDIYAAANFVTDRQTDEQGNLE